MNPYKKKFQHYGNPFKYSLQKTDDSKWNYEEEITVMNLNIDQSNFDD